MTDLASSPPSAVSESPEGSEGSEGSTGSNRSDVSSAVSSVVAHARATFDSGRTKPYAWREAQLKALRELLIDNHDEIAKALDADLGKSAEEFWLTEMGLVVSEIDHTLKHLRRWLAPRRVSVPLRVQPGQAQIVREPLGVVLVIAPWNYPVLLTLGPLVGVLAAGNTAVVKPSEVAPATSAVIARLMSQHLDPEAVHVVEGGVAETTALLEERFDHIFYTGNGVVGRIVLEAAARHLTPVTLELGGKSPTFVDDGVDLEATARRIVWGKFTNAGQTCVAPDYVLGTRQTLDALKPLLIKAIRDSYGDDPRRSEDYGRIITERHLRRLIELIDPSRVVTGGESDLATRYLAPTVLDEVSLEDPVMGEEIFGPVLPLVEVSGVDEAIEVITRREKPLALYVFTSRPETRRRFVRDTSSGALSFNIPLAHLAVPELPFGGVGMSGMGAYHGEFSIDLFSHAKAVLRQPLRPDSTVVVRPPRTPVQRRLIDRLVFPGRRR